MGVTLPNHSKLVWALLASAALLPTYAQAEELNDDSASLAADDEQARGSTIIVTGVRSEGTDGYGVEEQSTATRLPLSQRETPQSVSVVTRQQIDDFQLNDVNALLTTVPGVPGLPPR